MASGSSQRDGLERLIEKQEEEIDAITRKIDLFKNYKDDYRKLKLLIDQMQDKVRHPYKIPIAGTQLAFVKGHIVHTNELLVLLGDNYFCLRSSRQADKLIDRRLESINETLKKDEEALRKTTDWLKFSKERMQEKQEFVEIIETM